MISQTYAMIDENSKKQFKELKKAYQLRKILTKSTKQKTIIIIDTHGKPVIKNAALLTT